LDMSLDVVILKLENIMPLKSSKINSKAKKKHLIKGRYRYLKGLKK